MLNSHTGLLLKMVVYQGSNLLCNTSTGALRLLVPASKRRTVFEYMHRLSHVVQQDKLQLVATCFLWPGLAADVVAWCKECAACNRAKVTRQPTTSFSHEHMDIVGPLPP